MLAKRDINHIHFKGRLKQRYGIRLNLGEIETLSQGLDEENAFCLKYKNQTQRRCFAVINLENKYIGVVYDISNKSIVTALTPEQWENTMKITPEEAWKLKRLPRQDFLNDMNKSDGFILALRKIQNKPSRGIDLNKSLYHKYILPAIKHGYIKFSGTHPLLGKLELTSSGLTFLQMKETTWLESEKGNLTENERQIIELLQRHIRQNNLN